MSETVLVRFFEAQESKLETFASTVEKNSLSPSEEEVLMPESWGCFAGAASFDRFSFHRLSFDRLSFNRLPFDTLLGR